MVVGAGVKLRLQVDTVQKFCGVSVSWAKLNCLNRLNWGFADVLSKSPVVTLFEWPLLEAEAKAEKSQMFPTKLSARRPR